MPILLLFALFLARGVAQDPVAPDPVAPGAAPKLVAEGFRFTEGPAADAAGNVWFTDIPNSRIHRIGLDGKVSVAREDSGGANGLMFARDGRLVACEGGARRVTAMGTDGRIEVLAATFDGKPFNSPNDLWIDPAGGIWFTDPRYGDQSDLQQGGFHVYYFAPGTRKVSRPIADLVKPNGIIGSRDGKTLYVADAGAGRIYRYAVVAAGRVKDKRLFVSSGSDGMTLDERGQLYLTTGGVDVYGPDGKLVRKIEVPRRPANVCFGGPKRRTLFITARQAVYSLDMAVGGQ